MSHKYPHNNPIIYVLYGLHPSILVPPTFVRAIAKMKVIYHEGKQESTNKNPYPSLLVTLIMEDRHFPLDISFCTI